MKDKFKIIKIINCLAIVLLYHIAGNNNMFLYATTLCLYSIYTSCFKHITLKETFTKVKQNYSKFKILKYTTIILVCTCSLFIVTSILLSDIMNILLGIENTFIPYLIMSITIITKPLIKIFLEYLESYNKPKLAARLFNTYHILEIIFLLIIGVFTLSVFKIPTHIAISLLYTSKIISFILVGTITLLVLNKQNINFDKQPEDNTLNYKKTIKEIITKNNHKSIVKIIKNSYYYISIIVLYTVLSTRYSYNINEIENIITFIYLYGFNLINILIEIIQSTLINDEQNIINKILKTFKIMITLSIFLGVTSPLICNIIFGNNTHSIYLVMLSYLSIFIALFNVTFDNISNKKVIYTSLIIGIISKIILIIPSINSFYRMGYNLINGDIISTIISMFISVVINYIYLKTKNKKTKTLENIMKTLYESIILCIILVIIQFVIPTNVESYIKSILLFAVYVFIFIAFLSFKKKKRG